MCLLTSFDTPEKKGILVVNFGRTPVPCELHVPHGSWKLPLSFQREWFYANSASQGLPPSDYSCLSKDDSGYPIQKKQFCNIPGFWPFKGGSSQDWKTLRYCWTVQYRVQGMKYSGPNCILQRSPRFKKLNSKQYLIISETNKYHSVQSAVKWQRQTSL